MDTDDRERLKNILIDHPHDLLPHERKEILLALLNDKETNQ